MLRGPPRRFCSAVSGRYLVQQVLRLLGDELLKGFEIVNDHFASVYFYDTFFLQPRLGAGDFLADRSE